MQLQQPWPLQSRLTYFVVCPYSFSSLLHLAPCCALVPGFSESGDRVDDLTCGHDGTGLRRTKAHCSSARLRCADSAIQLLTVPAISRSRCGPVFSPLPTGRLCELSARPRFMILTPLFMAASRPRACRRIY